MENCRNWKLVPSKLRNRGDSPNVGEEPLEHEEKLPNASGLCDPEKTKKPLSKLLRRHWTLVWPVNDRPVIINPFRVRNTGLSLVWPAYYRPSVILPKKEKNHRDMRGLLLMPPGNVIRGWQRNLFMKKLLWRTVFLHEQKTTGLWCSTHIESETQDCLLYDQHTTDPRWFSQGGRRTTGTWGDYS